MEGQFPPTPRGEIPMLRAHRLTTLLMSVEIASRVAGSSTPRDRFPNEAEVNHRIELQPLRLGEIGIEVDPPQVRLGRSLSEQRSLLIGMHVGVEEHDSRRRSTTPFTRIVEARAEDLAKFVERHRLRFRHFSHRTHRNSDAAAPRADPHVRGERLDGERTSDEMSLDDPNHVARRS